MSGQVDRYAPPQPPGRMRAVSLAILVHLALIGALTWGVNWREDPKAVSAEAELWSPTVQQAAPRPVETQPPPPAPAPAPAPAPPRPPEPAPVVQPPTPPGPTEAQIAMEREKQREAEAQRRQLEAERERKAEAERLAREQQRRKDAERAEARKREEAEQQRLAEQKKRQQAEQQRVAEQQKQEQLRRQQQEAQRVARLREENLKRIQGLAGATGPESATGTAPRATGPSDSYAGRIRARVRPNIVFTDPISGNPVTEVEVRMAPDGTITSRRLTKSSGSKAWDEAVLRALDRTEVLPRDLDGRVHSPLSMAFRPRD